MSPIATIFSNPIAASVAPPASGAGPDRLSLLGVGGRPSAVVGELVLEGTPVHYQGPATEFDFPAFTTTKGAQLVAIIAFNGNPISISGITGGGTWAERHASGTVDPLVEWSAQAAAALDGVTIHVTLSGASTYISAQLFAFSNQDTSTIWDGHANIPAFDDTYIADPLLISTSNANDVIIASFRMNATEHPTAGAGWNPIVADDYLLVEYMIVSEAQTDLSCGISTGYTDSSASIADALMAAA